MPGFRHFLARFRPAGSPGPAVGGAVPADRTAALAAELEPPLTALDDTAAEAERIRRAAAQEADRRRRAAAQRAEETVRTARERAPRLRRETAARLGAEAEAEAARAGVRAEAAVAELRARARARTPGLAARLVAQVTRELDTLADSAQTGPNRETPWARDGSPE
ncbi:hypothetical protein GA0115233_10112 [Streptomyces sp. DI166]|uniref:hypothetical protein n=1 Tax=Streptomyces sp. DI166 TaxID=1839783 RepID=UPI0007F3A314|nr:hypothetical protein [Streptomyces sp. DI166]SBT89630.1 hypothetical protein GA0115233_10112 [Streptomyces sp. DI166]